MSFNPVNRIAMRRIITLAAVVTLIVPASIATLIVFAAPASASPPTISSVRFVGSQAAPTVLVTGSGFGTVDSLGTAQPPSCAPQTGNDYGENLILRDTSVGWAGGEGPGDCIGLIIAKYTDTQIVFTLGSFYTPPSYVLAAGDNYQVTVLGTSSSGTVAYPPWVGDINTVAGNGTFDSTGSGDGTAATAAPLGEPSGVVFDAQGNEIIADTTEAIRIVAVSATNPGYVLESKCGGGSSPCTWTPGQIFTIAGTAGSAGFNGDGIPATTALLNDPYQMALDSDGNLVIADGDNQLIRVIALTGSESGYTLGNDCGGGSSPCTWTAGDIFTIASGAGRGVTLDGDGNVLFTSPAGLVQVLAVSELNPGYTLGGACSPSCTWSAGSIFTIAGDGTTGYNGDGTAALAAELDSPFGIAVDGQGNPVFTDSSNALVRVVAVSASNPGYFLGNNDCGPGGTDPCTWTVGNIYNIAGTGSPGGNGDEDGRTATNDNLDQPAAVTIDAQGNPIIADSADDLVQVVAVSATNPGYTLSNQCGGGELPCTWTPGTIYSIAGIVGASDGFNGDLIPGPTAQLDDPVGVALDQYGNVHLTDDGNARVREVTVAPMFTVPASAPEPDGFNTGYTVDNSVTLGATGQWTEQTVTDPCPPCQTPDGIAPFGDQSQWLAPGLNAFSLVGRLGTSGPWTELGSGPTTLNGSGTLYLAFNDLLSGYFDNGGSLNVSVLNALNLTTSYDTAGPTFATGTIDWQGTLTNSGSTSITDARLRASAGTQLHSAQTTVPTWQQFDVNGDPLNSPTACTPTILGSSLYDCVVGTIDPGDSIVVDANVVAQGLVPQTISDNFSLEQSDQTGGCPTGCAVPAAATSSQRIDGLLLNLSVPATIHAGVPLSVSGSLTNTSATDTIHNVTYSGTSDLGTSSSPPPGCDITNNNPLGTGAVLNCPVSFNLPAGATTPPQSPVVDTTGLAGHTIHFTFTASSEDLGDTYTATASVMVLASAALHTPATTAPVATTITAGSDAAWTIQVSNTAAIAAQGVTLTLDANANGSTPLSFDETAINSALGLPATAPTCVPGAGSTVVCSLADLPALSATQFSAFVLTNSLTAGTTITGDVTVSAANAPSTSGALGTVTVATCATGCTIGVAAPGNPFPSPAPTPTNPTQQVLVLSSNTAGSTALPPVNVTLASIDPSPSESASDEHLCPTAAGQTHCTSQISSVTANFGKYVDRKNPIRVTIVTRWGSNPIPAGQILMEKSTGGDPIFLPQCVVDASTREFNTPCVLPEVVRGGAANGNLTTYDSILFTGDDIHFARRTSTGGTVIEPPAAPTALTATAGIGKAVLKWKAPTVTNGAGVTGYVVTELLSGKAVKTLTYTTAALTQTVTGLVKGDSYTFKVAAKNVAGTGAASAASAAVKPISPPAAPTAVTATAGIGKAVLRWKAPTVTNGAAVSGYVVTVLIGGVVQKTVTYTTAALTQTVTGLVKGDSYTFKVAAKNVAGTGAASAVSNAVKPT